jgi:hypothetical protein
MDILEVRMRRNWPGGQVVLFIGEPSLVFAPSALLVLVLMLEVTVLYEVCAANEAAGNEDKDEYRRGRRKGENAHFELNDESDGEGEC